MEYLLVLSALFLAFCNGANDNFKGFATVWGSETLNYRTALKLATTATIAGSLCSLLLAEALAQQFSGKGLVPDVTANGPHFILSVTLGAALTVFAATRAGLPVSTTHALIGGLVGAGLGLGEVHIGKLANTFLLPLLVSPLLAATLGWLAYRFLRLNPAQNNCACVLASEPVTPAQAGAAMLSAAPALVIASDARCDTLSAPMARFSIARIKDRLHIFSAALICFARGVNDTPKLAALLIAAHARQFIVGADDRHDHGAWRSALRPPRRPYHEPSHHADRPHPGAGGQPHHCIVGAVRKQVRPAGLHYPRIGWIDCGCWRQRRYAQQSSHAQHHTVVAGDAAAGGAVRMAGAVGVANRQCHHAVTESRE